MTLDTNTIDTLIWAFVFLAAIQATATYSLVKLLVSGEGIFVRRGNADDRHAQVHSIGGRHQ